MKVHARFLCLVLLAAIFNAPSGWTLPVPDIPIVKDQVFTTVDGSELRYDIARPLKGNGPFPLVLCFHAGGWQLGDKKSYRDIIRQLADRGFVAATVNYRFAPKCKWPGQLEDARTALHYFRKNAASFNIDPGRVAAIGDDAGAHLALMLGLMGAKPNEPAENKIQAVVNFFAPLDLRTWNITSNWMEAQILLAFQKRSETIIVDLLGTADRKAPPFREASPITQVAAGAPPVLTVHGTKDPLVSVEQPKAFHEALRKAGIKEELLLVEGAEHSLASVNAPDDAGEKHMFAFLEQQLKPNP